MPSIQYGPYNTGEFYGGNDPELREISMKNLEQNFLQHKIKIFRGKENQCIKYIRKIRRKHNRKNWIIGLFSGLVGSIITTLVYVILT